MNTLLKATAASAALSTCAVVLIIASAAPQPPGAAAQDVEQVENGRLAAMEKGEIDEVAKAIADDFIVTNAAGRTSSKVEYLARLRGASAPRPHLVHDEVRIRVYGDAAIITGRSRSVINGQEQSGHVRYTHVYTKQSGAWQMVAMHVTTIAPNVPPRP